MSNFFNGHANTQLRCEWQMGLAHRCLLNTVNALNLNFYLFGFQTKNKASHNLSQILCLKTRQKCTDLGHRSENKCLNSFWLTEIHII